MGSRACLAALEKRNSLVPVRNKTMSYAFFWVIPQRLNFICQRFGTLCLGWGHVWGSFYTHLPAYEDGTECSEMSAYKIRRRGITHKKAYNIQDTAKVWNQEIKPCFLRNPARVLVQRVPITKYFVKKQVLYLHTYMTLMSNNWFTNYYFTCLSLVWWQTKLQCDMQGI